MAEASWTEEWRYISDNLIELFKPDDPNGNGEIEQYSLGDDTEIDISGQMYSSVDMVAYFPYLQYIDRVWWKREGELQSPPLTSSITNQDGSPLDPTVFNFETTTSTLSVETSDVAQTGKYQLQFKAENAGYDNAVVFDFSVHILLPHCELNTSSFKYKSEVGIDFCQ